MDINPFHGAYEFLSKVVDASTLLKIQDLAVAQRAQVSVEEARILWPKIKEFVRNNNGREPNINSYDDNERRLAEVLAYLRTQKSKKS